MSTFNYHPYYSYSGPTSSDCMMEELSIEEVQQRIKIFAEDIGAYFDEDEASIETDVDGIVCISTKLTQSQCDKRVKCCLNSLDLYARKVSA